MAEIADAGSGSIEDLVKGAREESEREAAPTDTPPAKAPRKTPRRRGKKRDLTEPLTELYATLGGGVFLISPADGALLLEHASNCAVALNALAQEKPAVYDALDKLCTGGAMGAVMIAHAPIVMGILGNHNLIPDIGKFLGGKSENGDKNSQDSAGPFRGPTDDGQPGPPASGNGSATTVGSVPKLSPVIMGPG